MSYLSQMLFQKKHYINLETAENSLHTLTDEDIDHLHETYLNMYDDIFAYSEKYSIKLIASGGTALGAVRHGGFIPWDDDFDLNIMREDYKKFILHFEEELGDRYYLLAPGYSQGVDAFFMRVMKKNTTFMTLADEKSPYPTGIYFDILPMDYAPSKRWQANIKGLVVDSLRFISYSVFWKQYRSQSLKDFMTNSDGKSYYRFRIFIGTIFSFLSAERWFALFDKFTQGKKSDYLTIAAGRNRYRGEILPIETFLPAKLVPFEDRQIYMENDSDTYLKHLYGDYMKIPEEKDREKHWFLKLDFNSERSKQ